MARRTRLRKKFFFESLQQQVTKQSRRTRVAQRVSKNDAAACRPTPCTVTTQRSAPPRPPMVTVVRAMRATYVVILSVRLGHKVGGRDRDEEQEERYAVGNGAGGARAASSVVLTRPMKAASMSDMSVGAA